MNTSDDNPPQSDDSQKRQELAPVLDYRNPRDEPSGSTASEVVKTLAVIVVLLAIFVTAVVLVVVAFHWFMSLA